ncbi:MAG TPA: hypothetical protein VIX12_09345 [Candidatus Binataceae bacterium]
MISATGVLQLRSIHSLLAHRVSDAEDSFAFDEIDARLSVPSDRANIALIPLGYPKGRWARPDGKAALAVTFWERWGERRDRVEG